MDNLDKDTPIIEGAKPFVMPDLGAIDVPKSAEDGVEMELIYEGNPTGWYVTVRGDHSHTVKSWQMGVGNKFRLKDWQEKRKSQKEQGPSLMTDEDLQLGLKGAAVRLSGFRGIPFNGEPFQYSQANALELVRRYPPFADQVLAFSADIGNFSKPLSTS